MSEKTNTKTDTKAIAKTDTNKATDTIMSMDDQGGELDVTLFKSKRTQADVLKAGGWTTQFVPLDEGDAVEGFLLGRGPVQVVGKEQKKPHSTWLFKLEGLNVVISIRGSEIREDGGVFGLDRDLEPMPLGIYLHVLKKEQEEIAGGRRANKWGVTVDTAKGTIDVSKFIRATNPAAPTFAQLPAHATPAPANGVGPERAIS